MLSGLTKAPELQFIHEMHYGEKSASVDRLQETANRFYVDQQSRNASRPVVSAGEPRWRRAHPTIAIDKRRMGTSSVTARNKCRITVRSRGKSGRTTAAAVGGVTQPKWCF